MKSLNVIAIIQARMGSTRLPGKVLADVHGKPMLLRLLERVGRCRKVNGICLATTILAQDRKLCELAQQVGANAISGSANDVLDRYMQAAEIANADVIVRITGDCPLIDPAIIDGLVTRFIDGEYDYVSNTIYPTYPDGMDCEVFSRDALEIAWRQARLLSEREHVTPFIKNHPERFRLDNVTLDQNAADLRLTVDEPEDLELVRKVFGHFGEQMFGLEEILTYLKQYPEVSRLNSRIQRDEGYQKSVRNDGAISMARFSKNGTGQKLYSKAKSLIPGGTQLLSKRPEMFLPDLWPSYFAKAKGAEVWDLDGNRFLDMAYSGIGSLILGAADPDVDGAVFEAISSGTMSTLNCPEEVELAEMLCDLHPWADMVRYARCGGEAMAVAIRIARAATGKDKVVLCGYHGWHDWYLAANLLENDGLSGHLLPGLDPSGVPRGLAGSVYTFRYNQLVELESILSQNPDKVAAVVMEPVRGIIPEEGFLQGVYSLAKRANAVLIFDEVSSGFRLTCGGAHLMYGITPDIAVFAKAISNGYPMAAIIGRKEVMEAAQKTFISSTYWTERIGPVAALATINKFVEQKVYLHLAKVGASIKQIWKESADRYGFAIEIGGMDPLCHFSFKTDDQKAMHTYFTQLMLARGILATKAFYANFSHSERHLQIFADAVEEVFGLVAKAIAANNVRELLHGPVAHDGFKRLNS